MFEYVERWDPVLLRLLLRAYMLRLDISLFLLLLFWLLTLLFVNEPIELYK